MTVSKCYQFLSYSGKTKLYPREVHGKRLLMYVNKYHTWNTWKLVHSASGTKHAVSLVSMHKGKPSYYAYSTGSKGSWTSLKTKNKVATSFYVIKGMAGKGVSFMPVKKRGYLLT